MMTFIYDRSRNDVINAKRLKEDKFLKGIALTDEEKAIMSKGTLGFDEISRIADNISTVKREIEENGYCAQIDISDSFRKQRFFTNWISCNFDGFTRYSRESIEFGDNTIVETAQQADKQGYVRNIVTTTTFNDDGIITMKVEGEKPL